MKYKNAPFYAIFSIIFWLFLTATLGAEDSYSTKPKVKPSKKPKSTVSKTVTSAHDPLNRQEVLALYKSGEFETLVSLLENVRRERNLRDKDDSIFIYKFLGVIYGSNEATRRKAESFLYQMLKLDPMENLSALGVGDSVESIFSRVRVRYGKAREDSLALLGLSPDGRPLMHASSTGIGKTKSVSDSNSVRANDTLAENSQNTKSRGIPTWVWIAGGGVTTVATVATILFINQEAEPNVHSIKNTFP